MLFFDGSAVDDGLAPLLNEACTVLSDMSPVLVAAMVVMLDPFLFGAVFLFGVVLLGAVLPCAFGSLVASSF